MSESNDKTPRVLICDKTAEQFPDEAIICKGLRLQEGTHVMVYINDMGEDTCLPVVTFVPRDREERHGTPSPNLLAQIPLETVLDGRVVDVLSFIRADLSVDMHDFMVDFLADVIMKEGQIEIENDEGDLRITLRLRDYEDYFVIENGFETDRLFDFPDDEGNYE